MCANEIRAFVQLQDKSPYRDPPSEQALLCKDPKTIIWNFWTCLVGHTPVPLKGIIGNDTQEDRLGIFIELVVCATFTL